jgi:putative exosortase-associated protein (TIGR04073 family)
MKRVTAFITLIMLLFFLAGTVSADDPVRKLTRGMSDIVASPFELFKGIEDAAIEKGVFGGVAIGTLQGIANAFTRAVKGACEVVTFPITFPGDCPPVDPEWK